MSNIKCRPIEKEEYELLIKTIANGYVELDGTRRKPNKQVATILVCECNLGARIVDILQLTLKNFETYENTVHIRLLEKKTKKYRKFSCSIVFYNYLLNYCMEMGITHKDRRIFDVGERNVQKIIKQTREYLEQTGQLKNVDRISTHSFRKRGAHSLFEGCGFRADVVCEWLNHSDIRTTIAYLGCTEGQMEEFLRNNVDIPSI